MTCPTCGQDALVPGTTTFATDSAGTVVVVRDVPAQVCGNCGEAFISDEVAAELEIQVIEPGPVEPRASSGTTSPSRLSPRAGGPRDSSNTEVFLSDFGLLEPGLVRDPPRV